MPGCLPDPARLEKCGRLAYVPPMWNEPYLETCCRAALHRLVLSDTGRPGGLKDGPCLHRLAGMGLACERADGRYAITPHGTARHASEIMKRAA